MLSFFEGHLVSLIYEDFQVFLLRDILSQARSKLSVNAKNTQILFLDEK